MTEQQMPARIWAHSTGQNYWLDYQPTYTCSTGFVRSDIAERMAEALEAILPFVPKSSFADGGPNSHSSHVAAADKGRSALSAFKDSAQDRCAS